MLPPLFVNRSHTRYLFLRRLRRAVILLVCFVTTRVLAPLGQRASESRYRLLLRCRRLLKREANWVYARVRLCCLFVCLCVVFALQPRCAFPFLFLSSRLVFIFLPSADPAAATDKRRQEGRGGRARTLLLLSSTVNTRCCAMLLFLFVISILAVFVCSRNGAIRFGCTRRSCGWVSLSGLFVPFYFIFFNTRAPPDIAERAK